MIILPDAQRTPEWCAAKIALPTASNFDRLMHDGTKRGRDKVAKFMRELATEWLLGRPVNEASSGFMERGTNMEEDARTFYEFLRDTPVQQVGLCLRDDRKAGASPDGLVGTDGAIEIKIPAATTHVEYLLNEQQLVDDYKAQVYGVLYITERAWIDVVSFNPVMPAVVVRVERDNEYLDELAQHIDTFVVRLDELKSELVAKGCKPTPPPTIKESLQVGIGDAEMRELENEWFGEPLQQPDWSVKGQA